MPWRYCSEDGWIHVVVDPDFRGDLVALARVHPVWIVDSEQNHPIIDAVWKVGANLGLFEVSRCGGAINPANKVASLLEILGVLDDHHASYSFIAHGLEPDESLVQLMAAEGFRIDEPTSDGFVASRISDVRDKLIGRTARNPNSIASDS
jgi:hypothetical protein